MSKKAFNPITDEVSIAKSHQSFDLAPEPEKLPELDTTTPAAPPRAIRRFTMADLPYYTAPLYKVLSADFPAVNERMYSSWLLGCINDNSCLFLCIDTEGPGTGAVCLAQLCHEPLVSTPYVHIVFVIGADDLRQQMYKHITKWAGEAGCKEVRMFREEDRKTFGDLSVEKRNLHIIKTSS